MGYMSVISKFPLGLLSPCGVRVLLLLLLLLLSLHLCLSLCASLFVSRCVSVSVSLCLFFFVFFYTTLVLRVSILGSGDLSLRRVLFGERQDNKVQEKSP